MRTRTRTRPGWHARTHCYVQNYVVFVEFCEHKRSSAHKTIVCWTNDTKLNFTAHRRIHRASCISRILLLSCVSLSYFDSFSWSNSILVSIRFRLSLPLSHVSFTPHLLLSLPPLSLGMCVCVCIYGDLCLAKLLNAFHIHIIYSMLVCFYPVWRNMSNLFFSR